MDNQNNNHVVDNMISFSHHFYTNEYHQKKLNNHLIFHIKDIIISLKGKAKEI